jgi:hypothetical protein
MTSITEARSDLETAIILALSARSSGVRKKDLVEKRKNGFHREYLDMSTLVTDKKRKPTAFYAFDVADSGSRLYSPQMEALVVNPYEVCRLGLEVGLFLEDGSLKWGAIYPMKKPNGIGALTNKPHSWFALHFRHIKASGDDEYRSEPFAMCQDGTIPLMSLRNGWKGFAAGTYRTEIEETVAMSLSVFEDAVRSSAYLATVQEHVKMMFPIGEDAYKAFFAMRDGYRDTPTGRKNPIVHWCAEHLRKRGDNGVSVVSKHKRGASEFICGPMKLTIEENDGYSAYA